MSKYELNERERQLIRFSLIEFQEKIMKEVFNIERSQEENESEYLEEEINKRRKTFKEIEKIIHKLYN